MFIFYHQSVLSETLLIIQAKLLFTDNMSEKNGVIEAYNKKQSYNGALRHLPDNNIQKNDEKLDNENSKQVISGGQGELRNKRQSLLVLQKVELETLTESMDEYKSKLRQPNLDNIDRRSYEMQIGQLVQSSNKNRVEIDKLNTTLKSLVSSNQRYRRELSLANQKAFQLQNSKRQLYQKYQMLRFQYDIMSSDFKSYKRQAEQNLQRLQKQLLFHKSYEDNLKANSEDLLKRVSFIPHYQSKIFQFENIVSFHKIQHQRMKDQIIRYQQKIANLQRNHSLLYEQKSKLQKEHYQLKKGNSQAQQKLAYFQKFSSKHQDSEKVQKQPKVLKEEEEKFVLLSEIIENQSQKIQKTVSTCKVLAETNSKLEQQKRALQVQLSNLKVVLSDYQKKINDSLNKNSIFLHQSNKYQAELEKRLAENNKKVTALQSQNQKSRAQVKKYSKMIASKVSQGEYLKRKLIEVQSDLREQFQKNFQEQKKSHCQELEGIQKKISQQNLQQLKDNNLMKQYSLIKQAEGAKTMQDDQKSVQNKALISQIQVLQQEIKNESAQIQHLKEERHQISLLLSNKTKENQKLKQKFFTLEQQFKYQLTSTIQELKKAYQKQIQTIKSEQKTKETQHFKENQTQTSHHNQLQLNRQNHDIQELTGQRNRLSLQVGELKGLLKQDDRKFSESWKEIARLHNLLQTNQLKYRTKIEVYFRNNLALQESLCKNQKILANKQILYEECLRLIRDLQENTAQSKTIFSKLQSQFVSIQLLTGQLKQQRDLLLKKNAILVKGIQHLNQEIKVVHDGAQNITLFFRKECDIDQNLQDHYNIIQKIFDSIETLKQADGSSPNLETASNL